MRPPLLRAASRARHAARRPSESGSRFRGLLLSLSLVSVFTMLGISAAGGTYALLMDSAPVAGATVSSGTLTLQVNGAATSPLGAFAVAPATPQARSFTVTNTGDTTATLSAGIAAVTTGIGGHATARLMPVATAAACRTGLTGSSAALNGFQNSALGELAPGGSVILCLEIGLASSTPSTLSGQSVAFTLTMTATQKVR